ncbi:MAG: 16S rRNA (cytosine(1402)-N(4))-methyltransferase RsmH [Longimicrobiales bacterium]
MDRDEAYHSPVMVEEVLEYLKPGRGGLYFDGTLGGGGHTKAILEAGVTACVIGVDQDTEALGVAERRLEQFGERVTLVHGNFADEAEALSSLLAGALLDLGISSHQIDEQSRGFSFRSGTPLDMRMDATSSDPTAADLLNELSERELADLFFHYGDERRSRRLAGEIVRTRKIKPFDTSDDLTSAMERSLGSRLEAQDKARIFQALRIAVNEELSVLERALEALREHLGEDGVLVVLSYHSLEDRRVKDAFREWSRSCICPPELPVCVCRGHALGETLTKRPLSPSPDEVSRNVRSRSVRMRAWRKAA